MNCHRDLAIWVEWGLSERSAKANLVNLLTQRLPWNPEDRDCPRPNSRSARIVHDGDPPSPIASPLAPPQLVLPYW